MLLSEHIKHCQELLEEYGDVECYTADDAEGNGYSKTYYPPSPVYVRKTDEIEVIPESSFEEYIEDDEEMANELKVNGIVLN